MRYYFSFVMVAVYLTLGLLFLFTDIGIDTFPAYRKPIGVTLLIYAVVRTILTIIKNKNSKNEY